MAPSCDRREGGLSHHNNRIDACGLCLRLSNWKYSVLWYVEWSEEVYVVFHTHPSLPRILLCAGYVDDETSAKYRLAEVFLARRSG